jgi:3-oxoacyl-[acyl-carrier protein] reductase
MTGVLYTAAAPTSAAVMGDALEEVAMELGLTGKVALVGGASRGIGRAVALGLAGEGCRVAICARRRERLESAAEEIRSATGAEVLAVVCDMARAEEIRRFVAAAAEAFGGIDIVVTTRAGRRPGRSTRTTRRRGSRRSARTS